jgi:hypothetical protein
MNDHRPSDFVIGFLAWLALGGLVAGLTGGCASTKPTKPYVIEYWGDPPVLTGSVEQASLSIGVLSTRMVYGGRSLLCPGADFDIAYSQEYFIEFGVTNRKSLLSFQATKGGIVHSMDEATKGFGPEDWFWLDLSSHGMQVPDYNGDEPSKFDTAWCLADGPWVDDDVGWTVKKIVPPCLIVFITDTCFSEGSFRKFIPFDDQSKPVIIRMRAFDWGGSMVQMAACRESESALGGTTGGQWHLALAETYKTSNTLREWFYAAAELVDGQTPVLVLYGPLAEWMLDQPLRK